jgi:hypothetical protein
MRGRIWRHYRPGQENDKRITAEYSHAAQECVRLIGEAEGRTVREIDNACRVYRMCEV